jgi:voltage-gated potassium channel
MFFGMRRICPCKFVVLSVRGSQAGENYFGSVQRNRGDTSIRATSTGVLIVFFRQLRLPVLLFSVFLLLCVLAYSNLERIEWQDALFWIFHPHAIHYDKVGDATKFFSLMVYLGVFAFQIWVAERMLVTIFRKQGREAWKQMVNDANLEKIRDHFIICGYGQVGRTVVDQLDRLKIPFVLIETNEGLYHQLLQEGIPVVHGDAKRHDTLQAAGIVRARGICVVIDNDADNLYVTVTAKAMNPKLRIITRAGQQRYAQAMRNSGADEVIIPEHEGGLMVGRMIEKYSVV